MAGRSEPMSTPSSPPRMSRPARGSMARRAELVALDLEDFGFLPDGSGRVLIRRSKTDQAGEGNTAYLARETVRVLQIWLEAAVMEEGAVFRRLVGRGGVGGRLGVDSVAQAGNTPLSDSHRGTMFSLPGQPGNYQVEFNEVSPDYFSMLGIPIVRGRNFAATETSSGAAVAIVTESTARLLTL